MPDIRFQDIWIEQCQATLGIKARFGVADAFDYLVGEKLGNYVEASQDRPEFARELPKFVSEIRRIFTRDELLGNLCHLENRLKAELSEVSTKDIIDELFAKHAAERLKRLVDMKEMLLSSHLGTS